MAQNKRLLAGALAIGALGQFDARDQSRRRTRCALAGVVDEAGEAQALGQFSLDCAQKVLSKATVPSSRRCREMKKISANPDKLLLRAQNSTTRLGFGLQTLAKVLITLQTLIKEGDERLAPREAPEDLNAAERLLWVTTELDELASKLQALSQQSGALRKRLDQQYAKALSPLPPSQYDSEDAPLTEAQRYARLRELLPFAQGATVDELIQSQAKFMADAKKVYQAAQGAPPGQQSQPDLSAGLQSNSQRLSPQGATTQQDPRG